ncbi:MAG: hypothetical protein SFV21_13015 [Rhodospirillaceae bacterium]|nr:hypothetical protein [Rhodospirillaceae bacterium]
MNSLSQIQSFVRITNVWDKQGTVSINVYNAGTRQIIGNIRSVKIESRQTIQLGASQLEQQALPSIVPALGVQYMIVVEGDFVGEAIHLSFDAKYGNVANLGGVIDLNRR